MTFRLCILGNSHLAALKDGWAANPGRWPGLSADFIGAHRNLLMETEIRDGHLIPVTADAQEAFLRLGRVESVNLSAYDGFVIAGCLVGLPSAASAYRDMRWTRLPSIADTPDLATMRPRLVSYPAARATVQSWLSDRLGLRFARHLRRGTDRPIWLTSQPRVSAAIRQSPRKTTLAHTEALRNGDGAALSALFDDAATRACSDSDAIFVPQPPHTIDADILTALPYVLGANRLAARPGLPQPPDDIMHANAGFGAAMLDVLAADITARPPQPG